MRVLLPVLALLLTCGCGREVSRSAKEIRLDSGPGIVISVSRRLAVWTTIRATETDRIQGWEEGSLPSLVVYATRDLQPVLLPVSVKAAIVWLDGETVVSVVPEARGGELPHIPPKEVTQALVVPVGTDLRGLAVGDKVCVVSGGGR